MDIGDPITSLVAARSATDHHVKKKTRYGAGSTTFLPDLMLGKPERKREHVQFCPHLGRNDNVGVRCSHYDWLSRAPKPSAMGLGNLPGR